MSDTDLPTSSNIFEQPDRTDEFATQVGQYEDSNLAGPSKGIPASEGAKRSFAEGGRLILSLEMERGLGFPDNYTRLPFSKRYR